MDICQVETGLLKKKPCGQPGVTHCLNCEQALCSKHAVPLLNEGGHKTGKFMCKECFAAQKEAAKMLPTTPSAVKKPDAPAAAAPKPAAPKPPAAAPVAAKTATATPAKPEPKKPDMDDSGPLEFTPTKK
jgi:cell division septation protein DedD